MSSEFGVKTDLLNRFSECDVKTNLVDNYVLRIGVKTSLNDNHFLGVWVEDISSTGTQSLVWKVVASPEFVSRGIYRDQTS